jgi:hypothetical protein
MKKLHIVCCCHSLDHQIVFLYDHEDDLMYCVVHLHSFKNVFKRLWTGIKYIFGYKSVYGNWDEIILKKEQIKEIMNFLEQRA